MRIALVSAASLTLLAVAVAGLGEPIRTHLLGAALLRTDQGDPNAALAWLDRAEALGADPAVAASLRARPLLMRGDSAAALAAYDLAVTAPDVMPGVFTARSELVLDLGADTTGLAADLAVGVDRCPDAKGPYVRARYHRLAGDDARALADLDAALDRAPRWPLAMFERANVLNALGRDAEARAAMRTLALLHPDDPLGHIGLAALHADRHEWEAVVPSAEALVRLNPRNVGDRFGATVAYHCAGDAEGVRKHLGAYVALGGDLERVDEAIVAVYRGDPGRLGQGCTVAE